MTLYTAPYNHKRVIRRPWTQENTGFWGFIAKLFDDNRTDWFSNSIDLSRYSEVSEYERDLIEIGKQVDFPEWELAYASELDTDYAIVHHGRGQIQRLHYSRLKHWNPPCEDLLEQDPWQ